MRLSSSSSRPLRLAAPVLGDACCGAGGQAPGGSVSRVHDGLVNIVVAHNNSGNAGDSGGASPSSTAVCST
ncbi:hypothetical protein Q5752_003529 [Cryptotrichosporon argae]